MIISIGTLPIVEYATPGTQEMANKIRPHLEKDIKAMILSRHGTLVCGSDLDEAFNGTERIENSVKILANAILMGG